jgi:hypothetical protein
MWLNNTFFRCFTISISSVVGRFVPMIMVVERGDATGAWYFSNFVVDSFSLEAWVKTNQKNDMQKGGECGVG